MYKTARRYTGQAFQRAKLKMQLHMDDWNTDDLFDDFSTKDDADVLTLEELREGFRNNFHVHLTPSHIQKFLRNPSDSSTDRSSFETGVKAVLDETRSA
jgi:hypothetical protein